ncbi:hypothetical protein Daudx_1929 [Candidatus Desulforudis audaxviator]|nr:hypothetical protein Daudx_1929 [Candidatus Desulforudis audaxviator]
MFTRYNTSTPSIEILKFWMMFFRFQPGSWLVVPSIHPSRQTLF